MFIRLVTALLVLAAHAFAQINTARLTGRITDTTGAVVPGAAITAESVSRGVRTETTSNDEGYYTLPPLDPGAYRVGVQKEGFKPVSRSGITLQVNQTARLDFELTVGDLTQTVEVTGAAPLVERESAAIGAVIENRKIVDLPLNARNPFALALLVPGVSPSGATVTQGAGSGNFIRSATFNINGGRGNTSEVLIDGANNTTNWSEAFNVTATIPSVDALEEFKVQTNSYSAEFGRSAGGVINMVLKSGTNSIHGSAYEFLRNSKMDSNNFFANRAGRALPSFQRNQFGASVGGPVVRDKAFFFVSYESLRERSANTMNTTFPTDIEKRGDFSRTGRVVGGQCVPMAIYDPVTTRTVDGRPVRDQFPGNVIPASRFDPLGARFAQLYPAPNLPGAECTGANNFYSLKSQANEVDQFDTKVDVAASARNRGFASFSWRRLKERAPDHYGTLGNTAYAFPFQTQPSGGLRLDYTRLQTANLILNLKMSVNRVEQNLPPIEDNFDLSSFGFSPAIQAQMTKPLSVPPVTVAEYAGLGRSCCTFAYLAVTTYNWKASGFWTRGKHSFKFGIETRLMQDFEHTGFDASGNFSFAKSFTQGPDPNAPRVDRGSGLASMLLGAGSGSVQIIPGVLTTSNYYALYLQDDWKLSPRLTLNLGLRYDVEPGRDERFNQLSYFDFGVASPLSQRVPGMTNLRGGLRFVGVDADRQFDTDYNNISPRVGLAYALTPKTVVRSGYGIFYIPFIGAAAGAGAGIAGFQSFTPWLNSLDGLTPLNYLSNAFPGGLDLPTRASQGLLTNVGSSFGDTGRDGAIDRRLRVGYMQQWNFNVQRELPGNLAVEAAYAGSKGTKLPNGPFGHQENQLRPEYMALGTALQQLVPNPFFGIITTRGALSQPTVTRGQLLRPYPHFQGIINFRPDSASSTYHALQVRVDKRFSRGFTLLAAYTNSKLLSDSDQVVNWIGPAYGGMDNYNRRLDRAVAAQDMSQRLVVSYVYELPVGRGKRFGSGWPGWAQTVAGSWQINGITTFGTGLPLPIGAPNNTNAFAAGQRPNVIGNPQLPGNRTTDQKLAQWFDTSVFTQPAAFTFGNGPRTLPNVRNDGPHTFDFSLFKLIPITERLRLDFRAEAFNLFNSPQFGGPATSLGGATFGVVAGQANAPRQMQMALKLIF